VARDEVKREKQAVAEKEDAAHRIVIELQREEDKLAALQAAQQAQMAASKEARLAKRGALRSVKGNLAEFRRQEQRLLAESAQLAGIATGSGGGGGTGTMIRPVNGPITSGFGYRIHPIFGYRRFHSGVDFGVGYGTPIRAADSGTVVYATGMGGYGNVIMINHGGGISTLYAHQSSFAVTGGSVGKGQVIGYVGSTGWSTGPHLHFEVRVNGSPVDPMGYIR
jgi:murein DD-endopeptidase MepM/ murein hydrolase activator NlpD